MKNLESIIIIQNLIFSSTCCCCSVFIENKIIAFCAGNNNA
ncbi:MAG TPA: hypothetical protein VJ962_08890 [Clostridia bacterium]|nr:hypothetical protein [Clostridia bacterium]